MKRLIFTAAMIAISAPAYAQNCSGGSAEALSVVEWSVAPGDAFGYPSADISVTLRNEMPDGFRMIDATVRFVDALGESIGAIEMPRTTKAAAGEVFTIDGVYPSRDLATMTEMHPDDVIVTACAKSAVTTDGERLTQLRSSAPSQPFTQSEEAGLLAAMRRCWNPPMAATSTPGLFVRLLVNLNPDGSVDGVPEILTGLANDLVRSTAASAQRAVQQCGPYSLPEASYDRWRQIEVTFDPSDL